MVPALGVGGMVTCLSHRDGDSAAPRRRIVVIVPPSADPAVTKLPEIRRRRRDSVQRTRARGVVDDRSDVLVAVSCAAVPYEALGEVAPL